MGRVWSTPYCCHHAYRSPLSLIGGLALAAILLLSSGCRKQAAFHRVAYDEPAQAGVPIGPAGAEARFPMAHRDHFAGMDVCADAAGKIVRKDKEPPKPGGLRVPLDEWLKGARDAVAAKPDPKKRQEETDHFVIEGVVLSLIHISEPTRPY